MVNHYKASNTILPAESMEEESVCFWNEGEKLSGMLHLPEKTPAPCLIYCHGFTGHKIEAHRLFVHAARYMAGAGFLVLRFDFRGSGESEGLFESMTVSGEISDLKKAITFILGRKETQDNKVGVLGLSLGAAVSILTASDDDRIAAVCSWSGPAGFNAPFQAAQSIVGKPISMTDLSQIDYVDMPSGYRLGRAFLEDIMKHDILGSCARISPRPILIVHGTLDRLVPVQDAERLFQSAREPKEKILIHKADHTFNRWDWQSETIERTNEWFNRAMILGKRTSVGKNGSMI